jgi:RNA polymerase sigma-70 factor, ECF subfamily
MSSARRDELDSFTDEQLVALARQGHGCAFGCLLQRHRPKCLKLAVGLLRNYADAEDEAQNAFMHAYKHLEQFREEAQFSTWLARIVVNQCLMAIRVRYRRRLTCLDECSDEEVSRRREISSSWADTESAVGTAELNGYVRSEIRRLPPLLRNVLVLRDLEQLPLDRTAERLGITAPAARSRLMRARLELRNRLTQKNAIARLSLFTLAGGRFGERVSAPHASLRRRCWASK